MNLQFSILTERLLLNPLDIADNNFIHLLLNTDGWKKFIGDRNIQNVEDAVAYIRRIRSNDNVSYWTATVKENMRTAGIVTFIKRDYLEYHDIGFAFLPEFSNKGYAYEATKAVLNKLKADYNILNFLATTIPENIDSIKLLTKLGFSFEREIVVEEKKLCVYGSMLKNK